MKVEKIDLDKTGYFSGSFLDYLAANEKLNPFYDVLPSIDEFEGVISRRAFSREKRQNLVDALKNQYGERELHSSVSNNIEALLSQKTYTITTGHQLNIFTGPLYFIYKIVTVINAAKELKAKHPDYHFVPVYWMASEDHDFEEISYFFLHNKKYLWETNQTGAVGHFNPKELEQLIRELPGDVSVFQKAYLENESLADACCQYVNELFAEQGLVVVDADNPSLKRELIPVMKTDIFDGIPDQLVTKQSESLASAGYKPQVNSREINFFYLHDGVRSRIETANDSFQVVDTDWSFSKSEIEKLIHEHPERFSPNVILRPLYQEMILPNLAYVGGPSELVYWLQLKTVFDHFEESFPILMPRNFGLVVPKNLQRTWSKTGFDFDRLFESTHDLETAWVKQNGHADLTFDKETKEIARHYELMKSKAAEVDSTLIQHLEALHAISSSKLEKAEKKLLKAEKRNHEAMLSQIHTVKKALFPNGSLQERRDNFLNFYQENPNFISELLDAFDPFDYRMHVLLQ